MITLSFVKAFKHAMKNLHRVKTILKSADYQLSSPNRQLLKE